MQRTIRYDRGDDGIVVLTLDDPKGSASTMNAAYRASMAAAVERLEASKDDITGVVITSAKKTFVAGGDLHDLRRATSEDAPEIAATVRETKSVLRRLETLGRPVVAAINGAALGGGLEICLACHHRVIVDDGKAVVGFPEVQLGLLPGAGGVVRSVRLLGIADALVQLLLQGRRLEPADAKALRLVDELVPCVEDLLPAAKTWIAAAANLPAFPANLRKRLKGANYPAPKAIMAVAVESAQVDFDNALHIEGRYFGDLVTGEVAKNMIQAFFFDMQRVNGARGRGRDTQAFHPQKVVVLGAGMMGGAIAYVCARAGMDVVLKDVSLEAAQRGKGYSERLVARGKGGPELLERIHPTADAADGAGAELVIEAVFEDPAIKAAVFAELEPHLAPGSLLGSNTSTLPITELAEVVSRAADFVGLHFFSPVDKMPLLEIIKGRQTSQETLHRALDVAKPIRKTPTVVNDSRGFFTSRVIGAFVNEGIAMLAEAVPAQSIEQASAQAGYPAPVLQLCDELSLELMAKIRSASKQAVEARGVAREDHPAFPVIEQMLSQGRAGRLRGAGFYEYEDAKRTRLWPGLRERFGGTDLDLPFEDLKERFLFVEAIEAIRCLDEGVVESVADANIGSILGIGFPGWTGDVLQYINGYPGGLTGSVTRARELAARHGERFHPPTSLVQRAERGETYSDDAVEVAAQS